MVNDIDLNGEQNEKTGPSVMLKKGEYYWFHGLMNEDGGGDWWTAAWSM